MSSNMINCSFPRNELFLFIHTKCCLVNEHQVPLCEIENFHLFCLQHEQFFLSRSKTASVDANNL